MNLRNVAASLTPDEVAVLIQVSVAAETAESAVLYGRLPAEVAKPTVERLRKLKLVEWDGAEWGYYLTDDGHAVARLHP